MTHYILGQTFADPDGNDVHSDLVRIYMAGPMGDPWLGSMTHRPSRLPYIHVEDDNLLTVTAVDNFDGRIDAPFIYCGPYGDDQGNHSFSHGLDYAANHGVERNIVMRALNGIAACDAVVALVDETSYGTLYELGYAFALRKPTFVMVRVAEPFVDEEGIRRKRVDLDPNWCNGETELWFAASQAVSACKVIHSAVPLVSRAMVRKAQETVYAIRAREMQEAGQVFDALFGSLIARAEGRLS